VEIYKVKYITKVKLLLNEGLSFSVGKRVKMILNDIGVINLAKDRQKDLINLKGLLLVIKVSIRPRYRYITKDNKDIKDALGENAKT
jgi:hypothetical protein